MKSVLALALFLSAGSAFAKPYYTVEHTCAESQNLVAVHGAIVLHQTPAIYDRYVAHQGYCSNAGDETTRPAYVASRDTAQCFVGYYCAQDNRGNGGN